MREICLVVLVITMAGLMGTASADVIIGTQTYQYIADKYTYENYWQNFNTGVDFDSGTEQKLKVNDNWVGKAKIDNWQDLCIDPNHEDQSNIPVHAEQYGTSYLQLNNYEEPGELKVQINDFEFASTQGGAVDFISEGLTWADSWVESSAKGMTNPDNAFLLHDVKFVDKNYAMMGANSEMCDGCGCGCGGSKPNCEDTAIIKHGTFTYDCVGAANVQFQDSITEHADIASGMSISAFAEAKVLPGNDYGTVNTWGEFDQYGMLFIDDW